MACGKGRPVRRLDAVDGLECVTGEAGKGMPVGSCWCVAGAGCEGTESGTPKDAC